MSSRAISKAFTLVTLNLAHEYESDSPLFSVTRDYMFGLCSIYTDEVAAVPNSYSSVLDGVVKNADNLKQMSNADLKKWLVQREEESYEAATLSSATQKVPNGEGKPQCPVQ